MRAESLEADGSFEAARIHALKADGWQPNMLAVFSVQSGSSVPMPWGVIAFPNLILSDQKTLWGGPAQLVACAVDLRLGLGLSELPHPVAQSLGGPMVGLAPQIQQLSRAGELVGMFLPLAMVRDQGCPASPIGSEGRPRRGMMSDSSGFVP